MSGLDGSKVFDSLIRIEGKLSKHDVQLDRIEEQAKKTNGRVTTLEKKHDVVIKEADNVNVAGDAKFGLSKTEVTLLASMVIAVSSVILEVIKRL